MSEGLDGLLRVRKPSGPTSHDVVARLRRVTGQRRIGHSGTLDPGAEGLLLVALGRATRLIRFLPAAPKRYRGTFLLGRTSSTDDVWGEPLERHAGPLPGPEAVAAAAASLEGHGPQVPPAVSARRVGGRRLYELARRGEPVAGAARPVEVCGFRAWPVAGAEDRYAFEVAVSAGTYVRSLVRDLGRGLGCGGVLESLERTSIGELGLEGALEVDPRGERPSSEEVRLALVPLGQMPLTPPPLSLDEATARRFVAGIRVPCDAGLAGWMRTLGPDGTLLGIGEAQDGSLAPRVVLPPLAPTGG